ncbi:sulfatase family protein [Limnoglobus roseus]|uniref:Arylsulfatase n=1 Tax=Limnoglobus roseus TaxID=2598579 RepID=A0A5C1A9N9_9BACT|nr:arylsulfatase [Limnoglobus roseus]QEL16089.1 arylsulfatase [Limnoglobus roseus]
MRTIALLLALTVTASAAPKPNVVVILADDIGYGDFSCYGAPKIHTPNIDKLAAAGTKFLDAHSPAAVCTPTRYSLLTGQYSFRHKPGASILSGLAPLSIPLDRPTLPKMMKQAGYATGIVGKWHLGLGEQEPDYNAEVKPGPREVGFDSSFIIPATGDRTPCVYLENGRVVGLDPDDPIHVSYKNKVGTEPTGKENPDQLFNQKPSHGHDMTIVNGISRIGWMTGGKAARWKDEDIADTITAKAVKFLDDHKAEPFFLYFATHDAHVPRMPHPRFRGKSQHGLRGDAIEEFDWCVGEVMKKLDDLKLTDNTLVIVTSDNGGVMDDGYVDGTGNDPSGHKCNGKLRGVKGANYEGGHRVPFVARYPGVVPAGQESNALVCHVDLFATCAAMVGAKLDGDAAPDSFNQWPTLQGKNPTGRDQLLTQAGNFNAHALRQGPWKLIVPAMAKFSPELYNLADDLAETKNLAEANTAKVKEMMEALQKVRTATKTRE